MELSIIIPAKNEGKYIEKLLKSIKRQSFKDYEIIVAIDYCTDNTEKISKKYGNIVKGHWGHPGTARNAGARKAKGKNLLFLDADVMLPNGFLKKNLSEFKERKLETGTTYVKPMTKKLIDKIIHDYYWNLLYFVGKFKSHYACGFCIFSTKKFFNKVNGFDEKITLGEDHNFVGKSKKFGILQGPRINVSVRRLDTEGRFEFVWKMLVAYLHRKFVGEIKNNKIKYEFHHKKS